MVSGVAGGCFFVIIGALFFIKQGVKLLIRTNKTNNDRRNNEQSPNRKKAIPSDDDFKSIQSKRSVIVSKLDDALPVEKERRFEESEKTDKPINDSEEISNTSAGYEESLRKEADTDRKSGETIML